MNVTCPHCSVEMDMFYGRQGAIPRVDDVLVCDKCFCVSIFDIADDEETLTLQKPSTEVMEILMTDKNVLAIISLLSTRGEHL